MIQLVKEVINIETNINHVEEGLHKFGIQTKQENGEYRAFSEVIFDVCDVLEKIKNNSSEEEYEKQQAYLSQLIFGKRNQNLLYQITKY